MTPLADDTKFAVVVGGDLSFYEATQGGCSLGVLDLSARSFVTTKLSEENSVSDVQ